MQHQDTEVSDIDIVLKRECAEKLGETINQLKNLGMTIEKTDADNGVIEGTLATDKLAALRKWPCVEYLRVEFTYMAHYPPDDPHNHDSPDRTDDSDNDII